MRLIGSVDPAARRAAGYWWFNSLPATQAMRCLVNADMEPDLAAELAGRRPLAKGWLTEADDGTAARCQALSSMLEGRPLT